MTKKDKMKDSDMEKHKVNYTHLETMREILIEEWRKERWIPEEDNVNDSGKINLLLIRNLSAFINWVA